MADEATQDKAPDGVEQAPDGNGDGRPEENVRAELERRKAAERKAKQEADELRARLDELESRDMSEAERAKKRAEQAETLLQQMQNKVTTLEKGAWVRSAAAEMNFHDPEDAFSLLQGQLAGFEDPREAKRAVQQIAKSKKHLIREEKKDERPSLSRVFSGSANDQQQNGQNGGARQMTPQQMAAERELEFAKSLGDHLSRFRDGWHQSNNGIF